MATVGPRDAVHRYRGWALAAVLLVLAVETLSGQVAIDLVLGADRNVDSPGAETDGWVQLTAEWVSPSGFGVGLGLDQYFDTVTPSPSELEAAALYLSASYRLLDRRLSPFVRGGVGAGRAPCEGDTCGDGLHVRGSLGLRLHLSPAFSLVGETGLSRVSRPFGGIGATFTL